MQLDVCAENECYAESKTCLARHAYLQEFFDPNRGPNILGSREAERYPEAYSVPWYRQLSDPHQPKMALALPEPVVDYPRTRLREKTLVIDTTIKVEDLRDRRSIRLVVPADHVRDIFIRCGSPHHRHRLGLLHVELTKFHCTGCIAPSLLYSTLDMTSPHPKPTLADIEAKTERDWFHKNVYHIKHGAKSMENYSCLLVCNSDRQNHHTPPQSLYHDTMGTGLRTLVYYEAVNRRFDGMADLQSFPNRVAVDAPMVVPNNGGNLTSNPMTVWVLNYLKDHGLNPAGVDDRRTRILLEPHMYKAICDDLTCKTKEGSCLLEEDLTFEFRPLHLESWLQAFAKAEASKPITFTATLNFVAVVLGHP